MKRLPFTTFNPYNLRVFSRSPWFQVLLLLIWIVIGTGLRLTQLTAKPPWMDEVATVIFSLGNSSQSIPLDRAIGLDTLLTPLQPTPASGVSSVVQHLFAEDNHPPLYFMLAHQWMQFFPAEAGVASVWGARSLPALLGAASIPATFGLGWLAFRSLLVGQLSAALMAVSPYGIYLSQEARHYTLAILVVIASLCCLAIATQAIHNRKPLPIWLAVLWVTLNSLGIAIHYFFALALCAETLSLIGLRVWSWRRKQAWIQEWRMYLVAAGTLLGGLLWLPVWASFYGSEQTSWLSMGEQRSFLVWINPIFQSLAGWITMLMLLPVESENLLVVVASVLVMLVLLIWMTPILSQGLKTQFQKPSTRLGTQTLGSFVLAAIGLFFAVTYSSGLDITRGSRYNFVYFPGVIVLAGAGLAACWQAPALAQRRVLLGRLRLNSKQAVALVGLSGFLSAITVVTNLGFAKFYRPEWLIPIIQRESTAPVLIASTVHKTNHPSVIAPDFIGVAWEIKRHFSASSQNWVSPPQFLLAQYKQEPASAATTLAKVISDLPRPLDLWLVNFDAEAVNAQGCLAKTLAGKVSSYHYRHYQCPGPTKPDAGAER